MMTKTIKTNQQQKERIAHIDFITYFLGEVKRSDIVNRFGVKEAAATRDITLYKEIEPKNLVYDTKTKIYRQSEEFTPLFNHPIQKTLYKLMHGFDCGITEQDNALIQSEPPAQLHHPALDILSLITRAIHQKQVIELDYRSMSSGLTHRQIIPFALVDNGERWHVRAFDRKRQKFNDFVLTRIVDAEIAPSSLVKESEKSSADIQWNRIVEMEIVPHPQVKHKKTIEMDYGMVEGKLHINLRATVAGYFLRRWNVDCSKQHNLHGREIYLWLSNPQALYGVESAELAPGYEGA